MTIGQRIRRLRLEHGLSQEELGAKVGLQKAAINKYETGTVVNLKPAIVEGLAKVLHTTPAYLMGWEDPFDGLPHSEVELLPIPPRVTAMRPIVATAKAGWGGVVELEYDGYRAVTDLANPEEYVWIRVCGDSMEPSLLNGDYVLVHIQSTAENGNICLLYTSMRCARTARLPLIFISAFSESGCSITPLSLRTIIAWFFKTLLSFMMISALFPLPTRFSAVSPIRTP